MKKRAIKIINIILPLLLGVFFIYYAYQQFTTEQLNDIFVHFKAANYSFIVVASFFSLLSLWARAKRWNYALKYLGYQPSTVTNFLAICIGYLLNLTIPKSGEFSRALVVQKYKEVPFDKGFGTIVSERVIDLCCLLGCVLLALMLQYATLKDFLMKYVSWQQLTVLFFGGCFLLLLFFLIYKYSSWSFLLKLRRKVSGFIQGVASIFQMPYRLAFLFYTFLIWGGYIATFYFGMFAVEETSDLPFSIVMAAFVAGSFAVSFTNGGVGAFPLIIAELLSLFGISTVAGTAFGWILWGTQTSIVIILGALSFFVLPLLYKRN